MVSVENELGLYISRGSRTPVHFVPKVGLDIIYRLKLRSYLGAVYFHREVKDVDVFLKARIERHTFLLGLERELIGELPVPEGHELIGLLSYRLLIHQSMYLNSKIIRPHSYQGNSLLKRNRILTRPLMFHFDALSLLDLLSAGIIYYPFYPCSLRHPLLLHDESLVIILQRMLPYLPLFGWLGTMHGDELVSDWVRVEDLVLVQLRLGRSGLHGEED